MVPKNDLIAELGSAYLKANVVTKKSANDALHVAYATIARAAAIVSLNFKHIVRLDRMKGYNKVNLEMGIFFQFISLKVVLLDE